MVLSVRGVSEGGGRGVKEMVMLVWENMANRGIDCPFFYSLVV